MKRARAAVSLGLVAVGVCAGVGAAPRRPDAPPTRLAAAAASAEHRPLAFERNDGQTDPEVRYVARAGRGAVYVTAGGMTLSHADGARAPLFMRFAGGRAADVVATETLPGVVNYFLGNDPSKWLRHVPLAARAECRSVWPGIDVAFHGDERGLEYDFLVAAGADPAAIALEFGEGAALAVDAAGALVVGDDAAATVHAAPRVFQDGRELVGRFVLRGAGRVGFDVAGRDPARPLLVDPVIAFATYLGGTGSETPLDLAVDAAGNTIVSGASNSLDYPRVNALPGTPGGSSLDAVVSKLNPSGAKLIFSTYFGGAGADFGWAVRSHVSGIYLAGSTTSPDFPASGGAQTVLGGGGFEGDAFVARLSPAGDDLHFSTFLGGSLDEGCRALAVDKGGAAYIGGFTSSADFPVTAGAWQTVRRGSSDAFAAKISADGSTVVWATYFGGSTSPDVFDDLAVDALGNVYAAGYSGSSDLPTAGGLQEFPGGGTLDAMVVRFDSRGAKLACTYLGGGAADGARRIALDSAGRAHVAGFTVSLDFPVKNAVRPVSFGGTGTGDGFVAVLDPTLSQLFVSTFLGGSGDDDIQGLALGTDGRIFVSGNSTSAAFPTAAPIQAAGGGRDAFLTRFAPLASDIEWSTLIGGAGAEGSPAVGTDAFGDAYVVVSTTSVGLPLLCAVQPGIADGQDAYVLKLTDDTSETPLAPQTPTATAESPYAVRVRWTDPSRNECALRVERAGADGVFATLATLDTNTVEFLDQTVTPDTAYVYRVVAENEYGESPPSADASVATPETLVLGERKGTILSSSSVGKDRITISNVVRFDVKSADHTFVPPSEGLELLFGDPADPVRVVVPAGDPGWTTRGTLRYRWTSAKRTSPRIRLDIDITARTITLAASKFDFPIDPVGPVYFGLRLGDDAGDTTRTWRRNGRKTDQFRLP